MGVRLEDVTPGALVSGITGDSAVMVVAVRWIGSNALQLTYRTDGGWLDEHLLYRDHEPRLTLLGAPAAAAYDLSVEFSGIATAFDYPDTGKGGKGSRPSCSAGTPAM